MLTLEEYLLVCLMEEASEIQKACAKALRFGLDRHWAQEDKTTRLAIEEEVADLTGIVERLQQHGTLDRIRFAPEYKASKFATMLKVAIREGRVALTDEEKKTWGIDSI